MQHISAAVGFKPLNSNESVGVKLIQNQEDLEHAYKTLMKLSRFSNNLISGSSFLLEEFISGEIYSCEFIKDDSNLTILGVTNRKMSDPPFFIEMGYEFPYKDSDVDLIIEHTKSFIQDFNFDFGPCHIEFIMNNNVPYILEVNPRLIGYPNYWMINKSFSEDILFKICSLFIGKQVTFNEISTMYTICEEILASSEGYIDSINIDEKWNKHTDVWIIKNVQPNDYVYKGTSNKDVLIRILVAASNREKAITLLDQVKNDIKIVMRPKEVGIIGK